MRGQKPIDYVPRAGNDVIVAFEQQIAGGGNPIVMPSNIHPNG